jgi:hypothetical protein
MIGFMAVAENESENNQQILKTLRKPAKECMTRTAWRLINNVISVTHWF